MKEKFTNLLTVKSIVTILLTVTFVILALTHCITGQEFLTIFTVIISFYFGTQYEKKGLERAVETAPAPEMAEDCGTAKCPYLGANEGTNEFDPLEGAGGEP